MVLFFKRMERSNSSSSSNLYTHIKNKPTESVSVLHELHVLNVFFLFAVSSRKMG